MDAARLFELAVTLSSCTGLCFDISGVFDCLFCHCLQVRVEITRHSAKLHYILNMSP